MRKLLLAGAVSVAVGIALITLTGKGEKKKDIPVNCKDLLPLALKNADLKNATVVYAGRVPDSDYCRFILYEKPESGFVGRYGFYLISPKERQLIKNGLVLKEGKPLYSKEAVKALFAFKERNYERALARSIEMLKGFKEIAVIGNGTQKAYYLITPWEKCDAGSLKKLLSPYAEENLKILVLKPDGDIPVGFPIPFHQIVVVQKDRLLTGKYLPCGGEETERNLSESKKVSPSGENKTLKSVGR